MRNNQQRVAGLFMLMIMYSLNGSSQNIPKYEIGAGISGFVYQGDLTPSRLGSFRTIRVGLNLYFSKLLSPSFALRTNLALGGLRGDDGRYDKPAYRQQRNFNFRTPVIELSELLIWNPLKKNYDDKGFSPYLLAGAGFSVLKIKRDWSRYNAEYFTSTDVSAQLTIDADHSLPGLIPVIPLGAGLRYGLTPRIALSAETSYRLVFTDYLDGFSQSVNPAKNDHYQTYTIGAIYRIGKKNTLACPVVQY